MKNLTELLKSKDVGTTEGLVNLFVSAAVRGAVTESRIQTNTT